MQKTIIVTKYKYVQLPMCVYINIYLQFYI
jgi:hypothetical protein